MRAGAVLGRMLEERAKGRTGEAGLPAAFGGPFLSPMLAGAAMALSSVSVVTNSLRLAGRQLCGGPFPVAWPVGK